jgi:guanylate kinase
MAKIFLLDGPAGSGKSTLTPRLLNHFGERLRHCLRVTTRPKRPDDKNYLFIDQIQFGQYLTEGELAAYRVFANGYSYGVRRQPVEELVEKGYNVYSLLDLGTAEMAKTCWPDSVCIMLMAPLEVLEKRLREKGVHSKEQIAERLKNAQAAFSKAPYYDYVIPNREGHLLRATKQLISILEYEMRQELV